MTTPCVPLFGPLEGALVREPTGGGSGWWVGAPGVFHDDQTDLTWLCYRIREPRPVRGGITRIAVSRDGVTFDDVVECRKECLGSQSIERCALRRWPDGVWRWYLSYVDPETSQWRIDVAEADSPEQLDARRRHKVFCAADVPGIEGIKDPYLFELGGLTYMLCSIALRLDVDAASEPDKHATGDIYNTGLTVSSTGLATSQDGVGFDWLGVTDAPRGAWDRYCFRANCLVYAPPVFIAFYDGSASVAENYEERCGLAQSFDLRSYERISRDRPAVTVPYGSGSVRYVDCVEVGGRRRFYYEMVRPDGAHELRVCETDLA